MGSVTAAIHKGDEEAFHFALERLFERLLQMAGDVLQKLGIQPRLCEPGDLISGLYERMHNEWRRNGFDSADRREDIYPFIYICLTSVAMDIVRKEKAKKRDAARTVSFGSAEDLVSKSENPEAQAMFSELRHYLESEISEGTAKIISLRLLGLSQRAIAKELDISPQEVGRRLKSIQLSQYLSAWHRNE